MQKLHFEKNDFLVIIFENDYDWGGGSLTIEMSEYTHQKVVVKRPFGKTGFQVLITVVIWFIFMVCSGI